ncbi:MAG: hypothetical protein ACLFSZ_06830 [Puniceicoccaceae bacterium]
MSSHSLPSSTSANRPLEPATFAESFARPPAHCRPQPLWVWNDEVTRERIDETLEAFAARGIGGVFIHPRPGLVNDYLSEEWFDLWGHALARCTELGMECHIYDENSYPAGFAGGHAVASNPLLARTHLRRRVVRGPEPASQPGVECLAVHRATDGLTAGEPSEPQALPQASTENPLIVIEQAANAPGPFSANFPMVDLLRPEVSETFLRLTHERYHQHFAKSFGRQIRFAFADEPSVATGGIPGSRHLFNRFRRRCGYRLEDRLADLFEDSPTAPATRHDYWLTVHEQFVEGYLKPHHDWCEAHGIAFTGHFHEASWPSPEHQPSTMAALRWLQAPGNDLLGFQFKPTALEDNAIYLLNLSELDSVKRQCGRESSLVETTGGGGYGFAPRDFKPVEDFVMVEGVNLINPHLSHMTLAGARKYDWAHTIGDHAPWWDGYGAYADHIGRVNGLLSQGRPDHPVLVLHPSSSGWILHRAPAEPVHAKGKTPAIEALRKSQCDLLLRLRRAGIGFDLGDELILAELGRVEGNSLIVGECRYEALAVPDGTVNLPAATAGLIRRFAEAGGRVLSEVDGIEHIDGRPADAEFKEWFAAAIGAPLGREALVEALAPWPAGTLRPVGSDWGEVLAREVAIGPHKALFLCHPFDGRADITLDLGADPMALLDTGSGEVVAILSGETAFSFGPRDHRLLVSAELAADLPRRPTLDAPAQEIGIQLERIKPVGPNILALDYCDLTLDGETTPSLNTFVADREAFRAHDFDKNPWSFSIQFRRNFLKKPQAPDSGFTATYRFEIDAAALDSPLPESAELAVERPWLYRIAVNAQAVSFDDAPRWFDPNMRRAPLGDCLRAGENEITLTCQPFHALAEIAPVHLLGAFDLRPAERGFTVHAPAAPTLGDWTRAGRPFEPFGLRYAFTFELNTAAQGLEIDLADRIDASLAEIFLDGRPVGRLYNDPWRLDLPQSLEAGTHRLEILVRGNLKNLLGPHFSDGLSGPWSWEYSPRSQPAGADYRRFPSGLTSLPAVRSRVATD